VTLRKTVERRLKPMVDRLNTFLKEFEWTWTKAVLFSLFFWLSTVIATSAIPSAFLYLAQKLGWNDTFWLSKLVDFVGANLVVGPVVTAIVIGYLLQKQSRKVRGESGDTRPSGGYR
jgi:hypothetical protein